MVADFETRWKSKQYTLSDMTTEAYIRDPRFKAFGMGYKFLGDNKSYWVGEHGLEKFFASIDWSTTAVLCHNAMFDAAILSWVFDVHPAFIFDTLSMARALFGELGDTNIIRAGGSARKLAERFGLPPKGNAVYSTDGLEELSGAIEQELAEYCKHDVYLCEQFYLRMIENFPTKELRLIDMTLKMFTEPRLHLDGEMLEKALHAELTNRKALLKRFKVSEIDLGNNDTLAGLIAMLDFKPPMKRSPSNPDKQIYAFAKKDAGFQALLNSPNEDIVALCEARLCVKSAQERTRSQRFLEIAQRGTLPVPLNYYGAGPGRWTGTQNVNLQNLKRGGELRKAIMAPEGEQLVVGDLSQIEPRVLATLTDYADLLNIFKSGQDAYSLFGRQMFNNPEITKETHPVERQAAKSALLGCGYGLGWANFAGQLLVGFLGADPVLYGKLEAKALGVKSKDIERFMDWEPNLLRMRDIPHNCSTEELLVHCMVAKAIIDKYRKASTPVVDFWNFCDRMIERCLFIGGEHTYKCLEFSKEKIRLPSGMYLKYPDLRKTKDAQGKMQWVYGANGTTLYGSKVVENITQGVARIVMSDGMLRIQKRYPVLLTVHDELVVSASADEAKNALEWVLAQMCVEPRYLPGIPLAADGGTAVRYGDAKK